MHIIIDESLGLPESVTESAFIRSPKLKKDFPLMDYLNGSKKTFSQKLPLINRGLQDELEDVDKWLKEYKEVLYVYDSFITSKESINRLKNWYFPSHKLITLDGAINKSAAIYILQRIQEQEEENILPSFIPLQRFTITNHSKFHTAPNYLKLKRKKRKKNNKYYLMDSLSKELLLTGPKEELLRKVQEMSQTKSIFIASRENLDIDLASVSFFQLEENSLPLSFDNIDIFIA
ncbi:hypothetical protein RRV45_02930 [Bacillus sp. DTU_2020_1000418_1_SI_GHA_SEK_038]|uniref:hypothetical protein n=1 Tax=Bacillus sp. DTU_2020_1000418_1_SI_GHA_SEK_038 TaxID=3077585 RepID=UPI0028E5FDD8|nr:hypothetical protein [Bacillus sp. DTU_2020_1000418_1_SI_GHA_SEK_038]WNS75989.1 hypothetical protein RRV45_02930 [Bacillus sp. DTU_2020_1000418_1_SI_GHA_SEK_038]